ncbi:MAG: multicopper oxidase family protein [Myxococcota bacterium]
MRWTASVLLLLACGSPESSNDAVLAAPKLSDQNTAPGVAEFRVAASLSKAEFLSNKPTNVWAYRDASKPRSVGSVPGPMLEVNQGEHVVVHFRNDLPDATTIHWHGLRVPNASDGTPVAQQPVAPGATFEYEFDAHDAGFFWFHPHLQSDVQIERGLYAPLIVRSADEPVVDAERVLVLDDVKLESTGQLTENTDALDVMLGRQGNVLLVNGTRKPRYQAAAGSLERWRIVNVANGRYFNLSVPGHQLRVIGWDGGRLPKSYVIDTLLVVPGERYDVLVDLSATPGSVVPIQTVYYDRGHDIPDQGPLDLAELELGGGKAGGALPPGDNAAGFEPIAVDANTPVEQLVLSESEDGPEPRFFINDHELPEMTHLLGAPDTTVIWEVRNDSEMDHPFHVHGMFFQVLDINGVPPAHQGNKDTLNIPQKSTARLAIRYGESGRWVFHCHILEHAERGMMGELELSAP